MEDCAVKHRIPPHNLLHQFAATTGKLTLKTCTRKQDVYYITMHVSCPNIVRSWKNSIQSNLDLRTAWYYDLRTFVIRTVFFWRITLYTYIKFDIRTLVYVLDFDIRTSVFWYTTSCWWRDCWTKNELVKCSALSFRFCKFFHLLVWGMLMSGSQHAQSLQKRNWWLSLHFTVRSTSFDCQFLKFFGKGHWPIKPVYM